MLTVILHEAVLFSHLKENIDAHINKYTKENLPPPYQFFTLATQAGAGNAHFVQKVFEGAFEVREPLGSYTCPN